MENKEMSPRVARLILKIRDRICEGGDELDAIEDIWHNLYQIASPEFDKLADDVWTEIESIAKS